MREAVSYAIEHSKEKYKQLDPDNPAEREGVLLERIKDAWREVATHQQQDLDAKTAVFLLSKAGIKINLQEVKKGDKAPGRINLDTGGQEGVVFDKTSETLYLDHHAPHSGRATCAAKLVYETLVDLGLLNRTPALDKMIDFVVKIDNKTFSFTSPEVEKEHFERSHSTILGLQRYIAPENLLLYFESNDDPTKTLTAAELREYRLSGRNKEMAKSIKDSQSAMKAIEKAGFIIYTGDISKDGYGSIVVDVGKRIPLGADAAWAEGYDGYLNWNPLQNGFFITTKKPLDFDLPQGEKIRGTMIIKPFGDDEPSISVKLEDVLAKLTAAPYVLTEEQRKFMEAALATQKQELENKSFLGKLLEQSKSVVKDFRKAKTAITHWYNELTPAEKEIVNAVMLEVTMIGIKGVLEKLRRQSQGRQFSRPLPSIEFV